MNWELILHHPASISNYLSHPFRKMLMDGSRMGSISDSDSNDDEPSSAQTSYDLGKGVAIPRWERMMQGLSISSNPKLLKFTGLTGRSRTWVRLTQIWNVPSSCLGSR